MTLIESERDRVRQLLKRSHQARLFIGRRFFDAAECASEDAAEIEAR